MENGGKEENTSLIKYNFSVLVIAATEPGALELACVINAVQDIIVCGHSDCKVGTLYIFFCCPCAIFNRLMHYGCHARYLTVKFLFMQAMNLLQSLKAEGTPEDTDFTHSPLRSWLMRYGGDSWVHFEKMLQSKKNRLVFMEGNHAYEAVIDPKNEFNMADKFSQVTITYHV